GPDDEDWNEDDRQFGDFRQVLLCKIPEHRCSRDQQTNSACRKRISIAKNLLHGEPPSRSRGPFFTCRRCFSFENPYDDDGQQEQRQERGKRHCECLAICQRIKQASFSIFKEEYWKERCQDDQKRKHQRLRDGGNGSNDDLSLLGGDEVSAGG